MKADKRSVYVALARAPQEYSLLCNFCVYIRGDGNSSPCSDGGDYTCTHPLEAVNEGIFDWSYGDPSDCWGFRPAYSLQMTADLVGILLRQEFPEVWLSGREFTPEQVREHERLVAQGRIKPWRFGDTTRRWTEDDDLELLWWLRESDNHWVCG